jgi:hypothetical protein
MLALTRLVLTRLALTSVGKGTMRRYDALLCESIARRCYREAMFASRRGSRSLALAAPGLAALLCSLASCAADERPPPADYGSSGAPSKPGIPIPSTPSAECGDEEIPAVVDLPRLYFVLDRSGSMREALPGEGVDKWRGTQIAVAGLLRAIGHRVEYGAAIFPGQGGTCDAGREVFPFSPGDAAPAAPSNRNGPTLSFLLERLGVIEPDGGTPVAPTLAALRPALEGSGVRTYIVLATDGAPNCNSDARCDSTACIPDIEGAAFEGVACGTEFSCCDPRAIGAGAESNCVDGDATLAEVTALASAGIPTYVIGMPGASAYEALLDRLALAGGTARATTPRYFAVADAAELSEALFEIGTGVAISCDLTLAEVPRDASLVNVYYDGDVVPYGEQDGWVWDGDTSLLFRGASCDELRSGSVLRVSISYGCTTIIE